jgi:23S rRNA (pseudouridine1915-N3)-methyltransferase
MKIELWLTGKTAEPYLIEGIGKYEKKLKHYTSFSIRNFQLKKNSGKGDPLRLKEEEGKKMVAALQPGDYLVLLDEKGKEYTSREFAGFLEKRMGSSPRRLIFVVGGAFGFSRDLYERSNFQLSLSRMTFSHQMVRLFFLEQLYRAFSILRNEPYHND